MDRLFRQPRVLDRYRKLPFGSWLDGYVEHMEAQGYSRKTILSRLFFLREAGEFLESRCLDPRDLQENGVLESYLEHRSRIFARIHKRKIAQRYVQIIRSALVRFVLWARECRIIPSLPPPKEVSCASSPLIREYLDFCREHRGIGENSLWKHRHWLSRLERFIEEKGESGLCGISLSMLDRFTGQVGRSFSRSTAYNVVSVLRGFLRYLFLVGREPEDRSGLLEYPRVYSRMNVPRDLSDAQLEELLRKVDSGTPLGKRDWAVLMLLAGYGLRAGEVASLRLQDVDFERQRIFVRRMKGGGQQTFPMMAAVSEALREYLNGARPNCSHPEIFLTSNPPFRPFRNGSSLSYCCVRKYTDHLGIKSYRGAHALRHTLARRMLEVGAPLELVRMTLGQHDVRTTCRYLQISIDKLREVAETYADLL